MSTLIFYVLWVASTGLGGSLAPRLGLSPAVGALGGGALGVLAALALRSRWRNWIATRAKHGEAPRRPSSDTPTALWISRRGMASGYHRTDKLTPDGTLAGFDHDDFAPGFRPTYRVETPLAWTQQVFERLRSTEFASLSGSYSNPLILDGFTLQITWRLEGAEKRVWLANCEHPLLSRLVREVWSRAPQGAQRVYPEGMPTTS